MKLLTMKGRDAGLATVATKAMSLKARYYSKKEEATPTEEGNLARGTMVRVNGVTGNKELLYYIVLAVLPTIQQEMVCFEAFGPTCCLEEES